MDQREFRIQLSEECMALRDTDTEAFAVCIREELLENIDVLEEMVSPLCNSLREALGDGSIVIHEGCLNLTSGAAGEAQIDFEGYVFMGCKDIDGPVDHQEIVPFTIDPSGILTLRMIYPEEREPDAY